MSLPSPPGLFPAIFIMGQLANKDLLACCCYTTDGFRRQPGVAPGPLTLQVKEPRSAAPKYLVWVTGFGPAAS